MGTNTPSMCSGECYLFQYYESLYVLDICTLETGTFWKGLSSVQDCYNGRPMRLD